MAQSGTSLNAGAGFGQSTVLAAVKRVLDVVLPPRCLSCGTTVTGDGGLCGECWEAVSFLSAPLCSCCGYPFEFEAGDDVLCGQCLRRHPVFDRARAAFAYDEESRRIVIDYKHRDRTDMAPALARWMLQAGAELIAEADLITPVPLHWTRLIARRFNQSAELARRIAQESGTAYAPDLLRRRRRTPPQTGLAAGDRRRNVKGAFRVGRAGVAAISGKRILVIDDVLTTGSTVSACAGVLKWAGASAVDVLTVARVVRAEGGQADSGRTDSGPKDSGRMDSG